MHATASRLLLRCLVSAALLPAAAQAAPDCPVPPAPQGARSEMVTPDMTSRGMNTAIQAMTVPATVDGVLAHYRALWAPLATPQKPGFLENEANGWRIISHLREKCLTTVQVKSGQGGGAYALVAVAQAMDPNARPKGGALLDFPVLPGSRVLGDSSYADTVRNARTLVAVNGSRMATNVEFYGREMVSRGWLKLMQNTVATRNGPAEVLMLKRGTEEMHVVISAGEGGQTTIVANLLDRP